jgi:hypothetical protein
MRRVALASLARATPPARVAAAGKDGDMTEMFAEPLAPLPACVAPAAASPPPPVAAEAPRPAWRDRSFKKARALAARFRRAPREEQSAPDPRFERFQMRRSGPGPAD